MKRYKVKEAAEIAGMTAQTLRRYDKLGILQPIRDNGNQYRLYEWTDMVQLLRIKFLRSLGLDLSNVCDIYSNDIKNALETFYENEQALDLEIKVLERKKQQLHDHEARLDLWIRAKEQGYLLYPRPECIVFPFRTQDGINHEKHIIQNLKEILTEMPPLRSGILISQDDITSNSYHGVLFAFKNELQNPERLLSKGCITLPACESILIASDDVGTLRYRCDSQNKQSHGSIMETFVRSKGYKIAGPILGEVLHMQQLPECKDMPHMQNFHSYSLNWIPISSESNSTSNA